MRLLSISVLVLLAISNLGLVEAARTPAIKVIQDNGSSITIEFELQGYEIERIDVNGITCSRIKLPGQVTFLEKGLPELPTIARNIIIPDDALMDYRIVDVDYEIKTVETIVPSKGSFSRNIDPNTIPYTFDKFYQTDSWWPKNTIEIYEPFILRDYRGLTVRFNPFQYNPAKNELKIVKRLVVEIYEMSKGGANIITKKKDSITREFANIYENIFLNFNQARYDSISEQAGRMVIICADAYMSNMQDFKEWKRMKGIETKMVPISSIGNTEPNIKTYIQNEYDAGDLVWVLLVGDGNEVVPATGTVGWAAGEDADPVYAYTAGSDYYPDIFISRFSSRSGNSINIDKQVKRSIDYEKIPQTGADWYHIGLGVASEQGSPADSTRCNWLRDSLLQYNYTEVNKSYDYWGSSTMIKGFIEDGTSIINYIGHGSTSGWGNGGGFSISDINGLNNPWMLPFVISVACVVGNFNGSDCYCEVSVTAGEVDQPDGFLVHWGSSINQRWVEPCYGQEGAVNLLSHDNMNTAGGIFFNGACYMIEHYASAIEAVDMAQTWTIFGDASVQLRTDTPQSMTVNHASAINIGQTIFNVSVPGIQDALVGLYIDTLLVGHGYTDAGGNATITLDPPPSQPGTMYITVTGYNKIPYLGSVAITSSSGPYVVLGAQIIDDASGGNNDGVINPGETIDYGIYGKNVGTSTAFSIFGLLSETDPNVSLSTDSSWYGNIPDGDSSLSDPYYQFTVADNCPNNYIISFTLEFHDNNDSIWTWHPSITVYAPVLTFEQVSVVNDPNANGILDPGEDADLVVTIENEGGATAENITSTLITSSSYITINDSSGNFGSIDPGNTGTNSADPYNVTADISTPTGTVIDYQVEVVSGVYTDTLEFSLVIGKKHYYIWNPDPTPTPGQNMHTILTNLGYSGDYGTSLAADLGMYQAVLVCVGIYNNNHVIDASSSEAAALVDFLENQDGRIYLEGGDVWYYDPGYPGGYDFCPLFGIDPESDGSGNLGPVLGESGVFTEGMNFAYGGENSFIDHISPNTGTAFLIFHDGDNNYNCGVANDPGDYKTVGTSFELGLLTDGSPPSTCAALLDSIMRFFGITTGIEEAAGLAGLPMKTMLGAIYPNPFRRVTAIRYSIGDIQMQDARSKKQDISLKIYDACGRLVKDFNLQSEICNMQSSVVWNGTDQNNRKVPAGVYFVRFKAGDYKKTEKAILLR